MAKKRTQPLSYLKKTKCNRVKKYMGQDRRRKGAAVRGVRAEAVAHMVAAGIIGLATILSPPFYDHVIMARIFTNSGPFFPHI